MQLKQKNDIKKKVLVIYKELASNLYREYPAINHDEIRLVILQCITNHITDRTIQRFLRKTRTIREVKKIEKENLDELFLEIAPNK